MTAYRTGSPAGIHIALATAGVLIGLAGFSHAAPQQQQPPLPNDGVDQVRIEEAIRKGAAYLKSLRSTIDEYELPVDGLDRPLWEGELVLLALVHAGLPESDPDVKELMERMFKKELRDTYRVALQAMLMEKLDPLKYQTRIAQCAQFLVDNQCRNGQWSYGTVSPAAEAMAPPEQPKDTASGGGDKEAKPSSSSRGKTKALRQIQIAKKRDGPETGDNSNTQYAALGVRACHDAGILFPADVIRLARKWWVDSQHDDRKLKKAPQAGKGWCYSTPGTCLPSDHESYGGMTAGGVGSMAIYDFILGMDPKRDPVIADGVQWLAHTFSVTEHPGGTEFNRNNKSWMRLYYLYGIERACMLNGMEKLGTHAWYSEGAEMLLKLQSKEGFWTVDNGILDTCFAIFFLRRSTQPLLKVATGDAKRDKR